MSLFRRREPPLPKAAVCFSSPIRTRRAADWLKDLGGCRPIGVLSDDCGDVAWQCAAEKVDLLLLETDFTDGVEDKDVCLLYTSPSPRDSEASRMPSSA